MAMLSLDDALRIGTAARDRAADIGVGVTITIVDAGGSIRLQQRMDGARFGTLTVSANKAFTAAAFGAPTGFLGDLVQPGQPLYGFAEAAGGRIVTFAGGIPLILDGEIAGAIGISGGSVDQDQEIAAAGAAALEPSAVAA